MNRYSPRNITEVVIHHSVTPASQTLAKSLASFDANHKRLTAQGQPESGTEWRNIGYHYVVHATEGVANSRLDHIIGYHASNWEANKRSIGICLVGNFDQEYPSEAHIRAVSDLIKGLVGRYPNVNKVSAHREYSKKSCPGKNISDMIIESFQKLVNQDKLTDWQRRALRWAVSSRISNGERPLEPITRVETMELLRKFHEFISPQ